MFHGTTIEELINSVCRAEEHARREMDVQRQEASMPELWKQQMQCQEFVEVA